MIVIDQFEGKSVAVLGLGRTGLAAARALQAGGAEVCAWDDNAKQRELAAAQGVLIVDLARRDLADLEALVLSPGIPHTYPKPNHIVQLATACDLPVIGDLELYARQINSLPPAKRPIIIGVTGTNGKSTTTSLITHVLQQAGRDAHSGGNIGRACLDLPPIRAGQFHVLELSSYQLELVSSLRCNVAVLLNISPDHLDRHGGVDGYLAAKKRIFDNQQIEDLRVLGVDDETGAELRAELEEQDIAVAAVSSSKCLSRGVYLAANKLIGANSSGATELADLAQAPNLRGKHNGQNAGAAFAACQHVGLDANKIARGLYSFAGLAHRMEHLGLFGGIEFVNDSKATNSKAATQALSSFDNIFWIAGGKSKQEGLAATYPFLHKVRNAYLIGEAASEFESELGEKCQVKICRTLDRAFLSALRDARKHLQRGAVILLSPACASFDQFKDFEERGEAFRTLFTLARQEGGKR